MRSTVFALNLHATYRCHNSGECCSTDWDVPVELPIYRSLTEALDSGRLHTAAPADAARPFMVDTVEEETTVIFQRTLAAQCVFFEPASRLCIVHRDLGADALPVTCRTFPRLAVSDARGTFVTLSHFCPTAASMLFEPVTPAIVSSPPAFPPADYDGLVVTPDDWPPLLHPKMLMDLDGYARWESHMVARCADVERAPESILATLERDACLLRAWVPAHGPLVDAVDALPRPFVEASAPVTLDSSLRHFADVMKAVPAEFKPDADEDGLDVAYVQFVRDAWPRFHAPLVRYVAGKAFASWTAYQGKGVRTIVHGLDAALALVRVECARQCRDAVRPLDAGLLLDAFRFADFAINHLAVGEDLAVNWSVVEAD